MPSTRILKIMNDHHDPALEDKRVAELSDLLKKAKIGDNSPLAKAIFLTVRIKTDDLQRQVHNISDQLDSSDKELKAVMQDNLKIRALLAKQAPKKAARSKLTTKKKGKIK